MRDYTGGESVLSRLVQLLNDPHQVIAITTVRPEHWDGYTEAARTRADLSLSPAATAGRLQAGLPDLTGHHTRTAIPATFTAEGITTATRGLGARGRGDCAGRATGHLAQYLVGVPDLLSRYHGRVRYGRAIISAAMDAARLGWRSPLSEMLLIDAIIGYLKSDDCTSDASVWSKTALVWATEELMAVRAVSPVPSHTAPASTATGQPTTSSSTAGAAAVMNSAPANDGIPLPVRLPTPPTSPTLPALPSTTGCTATPPSCGQGRWPGAARMPPAPS